MNARFDDWEGEHLAHYGTRGMRWGQRRYQNEDGSLTSLGKARYGKNGDVSARKATRDLNKLDKESLEARYRARQIGKADKMDNLRAKAKQAAKSGRSDKAAKYNEKLAKLQNRLKNLDPKKRKKMEEYYKLANKSKGMSEKILKRLKTAGYDVNSKDIVRSVYSNKDHVMNVLGALGAAGTAIGTSYINPTGFGLGVAPVTGGYAKGKQYKVKKKKS